MGQHSERRDLSDVSIVISIDLQSINASNRSNEILVRN